MGRPPAVFRLAETFVARSPGIFMYDNWFAARRMRAERLAARRAHSTIWPGGNVRDSARDLDGRRMIEFLGFGVDLRKYSK